MFPKASPAPLKKLRITNFQGKTQYDALCRAFANTRPRVETVSTERTASGSELNLASLRISDIPALSTEPCQPWVNVSSLHTVTVMTASPSTRGHCCSAGPMPGVENHRRHRRHPSVSPPGIHCTLALGKRGRRRGASGKDAASGVLQCSPLIENLRFSEAQNRSQDQKTLKSL